MSHNTYIVKEKTTEIVGTDGIYQITLGKMSGFDRCKYSSYLALADKAIEAETGVNPEVLRKRISSNADLSLDEITTMNLLVLSGH